MNRIARFATIAGAALGVAGPVAPALAQADARPTVAIMFFDNNVYSKDARDYDGLSKGIADFLITEMSMNPGVRLLERGQVQKVVDEQKLVAGNPVDRETAVRLGKLLDADHMIFGGYTADASGNVRIDARAVAVEQGVIEYSERLHARADDVMALAARVARRLNAGMHLPPMASRSGDAGGAAVAQQAGAPAGSSNLSMKYVVMYGRALDLADRGEKARGIELLGAVLTEYPNFERARKARARLTGGG